MKVSQYFVPTLRDVPAEAEIPSHQLLLRAGYIRKLAAGVYTYLPLAWRVIRKFEQIVREEMDGIACWEMRMPTLHPKELLEESGRWNVPVVFKVEDEDFALGFTHEEVMADIARRDLRSWRDLPLLLYQMQTKFRDEPRPRGGVIRTREFIMFDAYSFDRDEAGADVSYKALWGAYDRIFARCGLQPVTVEADAGDIGGTDNHEFMVLSDVGEDTILMCAENGYAANAERCPCPPPVFAPSGDGEEKPLEIVSTPGARTIAEVAGMLGTAPENLVKTLIYQADDAAIAVLLRGDRELNEIKLARYVGAKKIALASGETVEKLTGAPVGFAGPSGLAGVRIIADNEIASMRNFITGANQADAHFVHVNIGRDFTPSEYADLRLAQAGDPCPTAPEFALTEARGVEIGHIFKLGTKYSEALGATFADEAGALKPIIMGSYGIGNSRMLAALIEASHDENGIIWHPNVAPFEVVIVIANIRDEAAKEAGQALHDALTARGLDVALDDRDERAGVKFKDADLVGYPVRVVIGKGLANGVVEMRARADAASSREVAVNEIETAVVTLLDELRGGNARPHL